MAFNLESSVIQSCWQWQNEHQPVNVEQLEVMYRLQPKQTRETVFETRPFLIEQNRKNNNEPYQCFVFRKDGGLSHHHSHTLIILNTRSSMQREHWASKLVSFYEGGKYTSSHQQVTFKGVIESNSELAHKGKTLPVEMFAVKLIQNSFIVCPKAVHKYTHTHTLV